MLPARIQLRRNPSHRREGFTPILLANAALALGFGAVSVWLDDSTSVAVWSAALGAVVLLVLLLWIRVRRRRLGATVMSIELSPTRLMFTTKGTNPRFAPLESLTVRRLAYLRNDGGPFDHAPVLELRIPDGPKFRILGPATQAWSQFDADLDSAPRHVVGADDWATLCRFLAPEQDQSDRR